MGFGFTEGVCHGFAQVGHQIPEPQGYVSNVAPAASRRLHIRDKPVEPSGVPFGFDDVDGTFNIFDWRADSE